MIEFNSKETKAALKKLNNIDVISSEIVKTHG